MVYIKQMELVKAGYRDNIDLRPYENVIRKCVREVAPTAVVLIYKHYYEIRTGSEITGNEARQIGRKMGKTQLSRYLIEHHYNGGFTGRSRQIFKEKK